MNGSSIFQAPLAEKGDKDAECKTAERRTLLKIRDGAAVIPWGHASTADAILILLATKSKGWANDS
jgi:hypothetical protein